MRRHLLSSVAAGAIVVALEGPSLAADPYLSPAADPYPPALTAPALWTGLFVGGHLGFGRARFSGTLDEGGDDISVSADASGPVGGMHIGQNWQNNTFVHGWEADISATGWGKHVGASDGTSDPYAHMDVNLLASLRYRIGMPLDRTLVYATGGLAYAHGEVTAGWGTTGFTQASLSKVGGVVGLGAEWMSSPNFSLRAEGLWYFFGDSTTLSNHDSTKTTKIKLKDALVLRLGATHHFSDLSPAHPYSPDLTAPALWTGLFVGGHLGFGQAQFSGTLDEGGDDISVSTAASGPVGGMHIGQNWRNNTFVHGWEADISATGWGKHVGASDGASDPYAHMDVNLLASLRYRIGMPLDRTLVYATGGLAYADGEVTAGWGTTGFTQASLSKVGGVVGLGAEWMSSANFSMRAEGLWYFFGDSTTLSNHDSTRTTKIKLKDALVFRLGATHHFSSDIRLKRDIVLLTRLESGIGLYRYRYRWSDEVYVGVMAHEVAKITPDAVAMGTDGYLKVDYRRLGMRLMTLHEWIGSYSRPRPGMAIAA